MKNTKNGWIFSVKETAKLYSAAERAAERVHAQPGPGIHPGEDDLVKLACSRCKKMVPTRRGTIEHVCRQCLDKQGPVDQWGDPIKERQYDNTDA